MISVDWQRFETMRITYAEAILKSAGWIPPMVKLEQHQEIECRFGGCGDNGAQSRHGIEGSADLHILSFRIEGLDRVYL